MIVSFSFIIATAVGTLSHEYGHYIVARSLGYKASIHYAYTDIDDTEFPGSINSLWISVGGPLQTLLTGTIGLILLIAYKKSFKARQELILGQWALVFITLFWLRQAINLIIWLVSYLFIKRFSFGGDEIRIALKLGLPFWSLAITTGITGMIILYIVIFKFIPKQQRLTFVLSGIVGGMAGYILWLYLLGPALLP